MKTAAYGLLGTSAALIGYAVYEPSWPFTVAAVVLFVFGVVAAGLVANREGRGT